MAAPVTFPPSAAGLEVLISRQRIAERVQELSAAIARDFAGKPLLLVGILKGAAIFLADLARALPLDASFDFIAVSSYGRSSRSSGVVRLLKDLNEDIAGKNVLLVEDILDTGLTLAYLRGLLADRSPRELRIAALLDKVSRHEIPIQADYVGFEIPDHFVVGYGLDFGERYRNLADICILPPTGGK